MCDHPKGDIRILYPGSTKWCSICGALWVEAENGWVMPTLESGQGTENFLKYTHATEMRKAAMVKVELSHMRLRKALVEERLAKLKSQSEPLSGLMAENISDRDRLYAAAFYVVVGRMPKCAKLAHNSKGDRDAD